MAEGKKSFIMYANWLEQIEKLDKTQRGDLLTVILQYVNDLNPDDPKDKMVDLVFSMIRQQMKRDLIKWEGTIVKRSESGYLGGIKSGESRRRKAKQKEANEASALKSKQTEANEAVNVNVNDNVSVTVNDNVNVNDIKNRVVEFASKLQPFINKYGKEMLNDFYGYWTEKNDRGKKMRFEMAKNQPFSVSRRLATWEKLDYNGSNNKKSRAQELLERNERLKQNNKDGQTQIQ